MVIQVNYPGVYIDEFAPAAPIEGVGTAVAAFLGVNAIGPPMTPKLLTSWDSYLTLFAPPSPTPPDDTDYLYYAVRGFFQNGGQTCYVTAVSNATPDTLNLPDEAGNNTITLTARIAGHSSPPIQVKAAASNSVTQVALFAPTANIVNGAGASVDVGDAAKAAQFLAGDAILVGTVPATVARTSGTIIYLTDVLPAAVNTGTVQFAQIAPYATTVRVVDAVPANPKSAAGLVAGSIVTFMQGTGATDPKQTTVVTGVRVERISPALTTYRITVRDGLVNFSLYAANPVTLQSEEFDLTVTQGLTTLPPYAGLSMEATNPRYYASVISNDPNGLVFARPYDPPNTEVLPKNRPAVPNPTPLVNGQAFDAQAIASRSSDYETALGLLEGISDINMVAAPDRTDQAVQLAILDHCTNLHDRVGIFDSVKVNLQQDKGSLLTAAINQSAGISDTKGFGALYFPWVAVSSVKTGQLIYIPPSGHVAGVYARTDINRGVFKAPAGTECSVNGALGVDLALSDIDQGNVNLHGVNVIRVFQTGGRPIVWGARTTSTDTNWQYINIRRLFLFLEESIQVGIRDAVFEPNNPALWQSLKRTIGAFLTQQWRDGALFGDKAENAFYVRIDDVLNPDSERALGRLTIEIGVRPSYPAEFIIVRIGIWQGGSDLTES